MKRIFTFGLYFIMALITIQSCGDSNNSDGSRLTPEQFQKKLQDVPGIIIDVRTKEEFGEGHLAITDHNFDLLNGTFEAKLDSLNKEKTYYLYCRSGNRSGQALELMKQEGFESVYNIGGLRDLVGAGFEKN